MVEWISAMTYQSASARGRAKHARASRADGRLHRSSAALLSDPVSAILDIDRASRAQSALRIFLRLNSACARRSLIPWIDKDLGDGRSREEWKAGAESNKIMETHGNGSLPGAGRGHLRARECMRCHFGRHSRSN